MTATSVITPAVVTTPNSTYVTPRGVGEQFIMWLAANIDFPAVVLLIIFMMGAWVLWQTQANKRNKFDFADMLRDETDKPSALRMAIFIGLGISSWAIMYMLVSNKGKIDTWIFVAYMVVWSGAKVADKLVDAYAGRSPYKPSLPPNRDDKDKKDRKDLTDCDDKSSQNHK